MGCEAKGRMCLIRAVVCLRAAPWVAGMDGRVVRCGITSSCQSAGTSKIVKRFWSRVWLM